MANHPHFRVVALTATPGRTPEKVQEIVDNLHISHIEIREAEAPEISRYMYKKVRTDRQELSGDTELIRLGHDRTSIVIGSR